MLQNPIPAVLAAVLAAGLLPAAAGAQKPAPASRPVAGPVRYSARHILIAWKGSRGATPDTKRTKEEARKKAEEVVRQLAGGADFAALAKANSVGPLRDSGGYLGQFRQGKMIEPFEKAVAGAEVGQIVGPVETAFGFHVIQRLAIAKPWPDKVAGSHILIAYKDAARAHPKLERSRAEALALARKLRAEIVSGKVSFAAAAKQHSDDTASGQRGGDLGTMRPEDFIPTFTDALCALDVGQVSEPVETPFGFHIIRRNVVVLPMRASHILIPWQGASRAPGDVTRSKAEALELAKQILARARNGENFGGLAKTYSSGPSKRSGGDLGEFQRGQMVKAFEDAVRKAKVGQIVGPVETQFGYHIIMRTQ